jgi:hypothetical protein
MCAWVDVTAPGDGCAFALCDPVAVSGVAGPDKRWPLVLSAAFSQTLSAGAWPRCAGGFSSGISSISTPSTTCRDGPGAYDYFAVTAGPRTLARAVFRAQALGQPDRDSGQPATRIARHDPPVTATCRRSPPRGSGVSRSGATCGFSARYPVGAARAALSRVDGGVPDAVLPVLPREPARSCRRILKARPLDFPKSDRVGEGLRPLLGASVFLTNGETWARQRRIIDPAFEGGRLRDTFPAMLERAVQRRHGWRTGEQDIEPAMSHAAADVIFPHAFLHPDRGRRRRGLQRIPGLSAQPADPEPARVSALAALDAPRAPGETCARRGASGR